MDKIDVSVIIINYNTYQLTCNCIQSVLDHTVAVQYEIILVDNASNECDPDLFKEKFPQVKLVKSAVNKGFAGGNNLGIAAATGNNILLLNSDTIFREDSISFIFNKTQHIQNLGVATIRMTYPDGTIQPAARKFPSVMAHFLKTTRLRKAFKKLYKEKISGFNFNESFTCDWVWGTFFYFPAKNLQLLGGRLPETYFMYSEDVEWCFLFKKHHLENYYFAGSTIIHLGGKSSTSAYKNKLLVKNHLHFIKLHYGYPCFLTEYLLQKADELETAIRFGNRKPLPIK